MVSPVKTKNTSGFAWVLMSMGLKYETRHINWVKNVKALLSTKKLRS